MNTTTINIKVEEKLKKDAQKLAKQMGFSLSGVLKGYLHHFLNTKKIEFEAEAEMRPSKKLLEMLRRSDEDIKAGRVITFYSPEEELAYLDKLIKEDEKNGN
jgi:addiction module RelB/DinJ family antitoxin